MIFTERFQCIFCESTLLNLIFDTDKTVPLGNFVVSDPDAPAHWMPYNVQYCRGCGAVQNKYVGDLNLIYENNFAGAWGSIRSTHNVLFADFILANKDIHSFCEVGAGNGSLSDLLLEKKPCPYTIIDPSFGGSREGKQVLSKYLEDCNDDDISANTLIMSHVFEHFYKPADIVKKLQSLQYLQSVYISLPDLEDFMKNGTYHVLNSEHTFFVTNSYIQRLFARFGFECRRTYYHEHHSVFFEFQKSTAVAMSLPPVLLDENTQEMTHTFFDRLRNNVAKVDLTNGPVYMWPCSMHTLFALSVGGLPADAITAVLDNSPLKIGKYLYGYGKPCLSFHEIIQSPQEKTILLTGGCYNKEVATIAQSYPQNHVYMI